MPNPDLYDVATTSPGPLGELPLTAEMLLDRPSGDLFGLSQDAGMGWDPAKLGGNEFLILSTLGGLRDVDGKPIALGYHTGHWEVGLLVRECAEELARQGAIPFAGFVSDPCDGRTQGTTGMFDSLPYRNDAAVVLRRLIRSLPNRRGVIGVATCDKGLPAMMMALAAMRDLPCAIVPGGVTLPPAHGEDAGKIQSIGARFSHGLITLKEAAEAGCRACATPGGGCQFFGTAATAQAVAEALGMTVPHAALAPSGQPIWLEIATRTALAMLELDRNGIDGKRILTDKAIENAMLVHAACGGSTNLLIHIPAIAHAAGLRRPTVEDWSRVNRMVPRLVDVLPNGPADHPTVRLYLAGGVPEVMLHLRRMGVLNTDCLTVSGKTVGENLDEWEGSERRQRVRQVLVEKDGVDPDDVISSPDQAAAKGLTRTLCFPVGNLAPEGSVIKATSIDPSVVGDDGVYRKRGPAKVFTSEHAAIAAIKSGGVKAGDVIVLTCCGPLGTGMEETYQLTSALKYLPFGKEVALITDARFSGVSTGACIGHVGPEALAGGPIGCVRDGDTIEIIVDRIHMTATVNVVDPPDFTSRPSRDDLSSHPLLPDDTRLWAALITASGGLWGGCVYDVEAIIGKLSGTGF
ncbi:dehydratase, YjhG/YagF family [Fimbriimonas ginsengisoli Gsoil 348]|uniref:Dehydratase, YjhG/YagF family n=1 Tax=Fimbriimonas ginsengisoli Gsoil 348 TaxID=661478 RepID=A0A068NKS1_FIMGI|nr:YjhG/YagF family D-xylonate dehydratase [Fimbriimonas ginsengisoli]AIE84183.1 dehydratase, YjhG/YagF family [Fimbriimonas ginsengisoli Gsoil 348]